MLLALRGCRGSDQCRACLCGRVLVFFRAASILSRSAMMISAAWVSMTAKEVSITSELVMPWCTKRLSSPTNSATDVRKAMTSCLTSASISSMRAISKLPFSRKALAALSGTMPRSAIFSRARVSTSSQILNLFSCSKMDAISGREYLGIMGYGLAGNYGLFKMCLVKSRGYYRFSIAMFAVLLLWFRLF